MCTLIRVPTPLHIFLQRGFQNNQCVTPSRLLFTTAAWNGKVPYVIAESGRMLLIRAQRQRASSPRAILWPFVLATPRVPCTFETGLQYTIVITSPLSSRQDPHQVDSDTMPALPPQDDILIQNLSETLRNAYVNYILPAEGDVTISGDNEKLIHTRILGALLIRAVERLDSLGKFYLHHYVCLCEYSIPVV